MRRAIAAASVALVVLAGALGCVPGGACPAIGWINTVTVDASAFGDAAFVQLCVPVGCSAAPGEHPSPSSDLRVPTSSADGGFAVGMTTPDSVTVRVYDADGILHEEAVEISWTHSDGPCGGPSVAGVIMVQP